MLGDGVEGVGRRAIDVNVLRGGDVGLWGNLPKI